MDITKREINISLVIAFFITTLTYASQFVLISINGDYSFISVVYHYFDSVKHLSKEFIIGVNILIDFLFYLGVLLLGFKIIRDNNSLLKYLIFSFVGIISIVLLYVNSLNLTALSKTDVRVYEHLGNHHFLLFYFLIALLLLLIPLAFKNDYKIINIEQEQDKLQRENIVSRYMALKNKLEPHFLFNSFSVLDALIDEDKDTAHKYLKDLSSIYRYILQEREDVALREALLEIKNYISILEFRHGDGVVFIQNIDEKYLDYKVIAMALHTIVENAVKHNTHTKDSPLTIRIETSEDANLIIINNLQLPQTPTSGNGIGLSSLCELYMSKWQKEIVISKNKGAFSVIIPLISRTIN